MHKFRLPLLLFVIGCSSIACTKIPLPHPTPPLIQTPGEVIHILEAKTPQQNLLPQNIQQLQSYQYNNNTYTHITYTNEQQAIATMVIESYYNTEGQLTYTSYRCDSNFCACQIIIELSELGEPAIRCSCTPCTMTIK
jgi:hypothetical protein